MESFAEESFAVESFAEENFAVAALMPGVARAVADLANKN